MTINVASLAIRPIGIVRSSRAETKDDFWGSVSGTIALDGDQFGPEALLGLAAFSHIEVVYHFHHVPEDRSERSSAPKAMPTSRTGRRS